MAASVKKREETQHAPETNQLRRPKNFSQRRNGKRDRHEPQRPIPRGVLEKLRGIRAEPAGKCFPDQHAQGDETDQEHNYLRPFAGQN